MTGEASNEKPARRITDYDVAKLIKQGHEELTADPAASQMAERIDRRAELAEDREHRRRSESSAVAGWLVGVLFLLAFVASFVVR
ncbi:hypothetical protein ABZ819_05690 [Streptomyces venezuelae]|uniref:hypothetical protein n=1 Tax=Streptomyces venezuelae TaxID=54571 RepID=UPI00341B54B7